MTATQFELVTPNRTLYSGEAEMVVCRTVDGEIAFLADHMPYIGALDPGLVRVVGPQSGGGEPASTEIRLAVKGGFVEVSNNRVIMLADVAELGSEVDIEAARRDETSAQEMLAGAGSEASPEVESDLRWAHARIEASTGVEAH